MDSGGCSGGWLRFRKRRRCVCRSNLLRCRLRSMPPRQEIALVGPGTYIENVFIPKSSLPAIDAGAVAHDDRRKRSRHPGRDLGHSYRKRHRLRIRLSRRCVPARLIAWLSNERGAGLRHSVATATFDEQHHHWQSWLWRRRHCFVLSSLAIRDNVVRENVADGLVRWERRRRLDQRRRQLYGRGRARTQSNFRQRRHGVVDRIRGQHQRARKHGRATAWILKTWPRVRRHRYRCHGRRHSNNLIARNFAYSAPAPSHQLSGSHSALAATGTSCWITMLWEITEAS